MVHSFRAWRNCTYETFMSAANTRSAHVFLCRLRLRKSFSRLQDCARAMREMRRKAGAVMRRWKQRELVIAFQSWQEERSRGMRIRAVTGKVVGRWRRGGMWKTFAAWKQYTLRLRHLHHVSVRLELHWTRINIAAAFATFKIVLSNAIEEVRLRRIAQAVALRTRRFSLRSWMSGWAWLAYRRRVM